MGCGALPTYLPILASDTMWPYEGYLILPRLIYLSVGDWYVLTELLLTLRVEEQQQQQKRLVKIY